MRGVRAPAVWLNVAVLGVLMALAYASPPDPTYLGGFWDNDDYDDVVILVTSSIGSSDRPFENRPTPVFVVVGLVVPREEERLATAPFARSSSRAPPIV